MNVEKPKSDEITISNNRVYTKISYDIIASPLWYIKHVPIPSIFDIPIDPYYEDMIVKELNNLGSFTILISIDIKFKLSRIYYIFKRNSLKRLHYKVSESVRQFKGLFDIEELISSTSIKIQNDQVGKIINIEKKIDNLIKDVKDIKKDSNS